MKNYFYKIHIKYLTSLILLIGILMAGNTFVYSMNDGTYVSNKKIKNSFTLIENDYSSSLVVSSSDFSGVHRVLSHFQTDIGNVGTSKPNIYHDELPQEEQIVIIGTIGKSSIINNLINSGKLDVTEMQGKWEKFIIETIDNPFPNIKKALVIAGSDKRGTIYGMFDLSEKIGVSPWYWWADVPIKKHEQVYILPGRYTLGEPKIKYRGIFINDEAPALANWSIAKFGTQQFNHKLYVHVFELILRLKGNFLWPAMWGRAFYDDDPLNPKLADEYGIVISTSHHEPMMRAHVEWRRYGEGAWNYEKNPKVLRKFWQEGIERMGDYESVVTLAMRGDGDEAMSESANISLLQKVVEDQRKIIGEVTGKRIEEVPQVWALYKEVQEYYDKGMRVPDDVTLLLCDDNWGNIRKLPNLNDPSRKGGYGIYYHYDYVGGPRNYKWINTNQIERVWEQMRMAYEYNANEIWIVNVGDIKPMEFPINFFLDYAWNPEAIRAEDLPNYYLQWASYQFGEQLSQDIAEILSKYTKFNSRRKPEMLSPETYSLDSYKEANRVVEEYNSVYEKAKNIYDVISEGYKDAFYQLVLHPVEASANLNELYVTVAKNRLYAEQGRSITNKLADKAVELYRRDSLITKYYNEELADGKWNHMMDQTHIGYTYWQQPESNSMPEVKRIELSDESELGLSVEGSNEAFEVGDYDAMLPIFYSHTNEKHYVEIFNKGRISIVYKISANSPWLQIGKNNGVVDYQEKIWISIDWSKLSVGEHQTKLSVISKDQNIEVNVKAVKIDNSISDLENCFIEANGYISIEAENYFDKTENEKVKWQIIPNLGKTSSAVTISPRTFESINLSENSPRLNYKTYFFSQGEYDINIYLSPILNYGYADGIKLAVSINNKLPEILNITKNDTPDWNYPFYWNEMVGNNIRKIRHKIIIDNPGVHTLKIWAVDPGIVLQKILIDTGGLKPSYLGPPQSYNKNLLN